MSGAVIALPDSSDDDDPDDNECPHCDGTGTQPGDLGAMICGHCGGDGYRSDPGDE